MRNLTVALIVVIGILGGFYAGWRYSQSQLSTTAAASTSGTPTSSGFGGGGGLLPAGPSGATGPGGGRGAGGGFGGAAAAGTVVSLAGNVLTVHDRASGQDVKVNLTPQTPVAKTTQGSTADLTPGTNVTVIGTTASDGSVDARAITLGGAARGG